ncbi:cupin domain-containing protein [Caenimonas sp. SL110]|uniref:cupin domain-containing protein n=1 Tax=Caenimonas sp. SL110 TaxID=1450524 RepID=UPI000654885D|nr:cupin domain-containing protein [Caenimonas sp. SL110]
MAINHANAGDVVDVRPLGAALATARSHAIFKADHLEVIRLVLQPGEQMPSHAVAGEITLQCIEGRIAFTCDAGARELAAGQLVRVAADEVHALRAIESSSLLLTIALTRSA